jgi:hypothetical protein
MAVFRQFTASSAYEAAAETAAGYLNELGIFDSVSVSGGTVTCTYGGSTVATFAWSNGRIDISFGPYTTYAGDCASFWIGRAQNGVLFCHSNQFVSGNTYHLYTACVCKSQNGSPMLIWHELNNNQVMPSVALTYNSVETPDADVPSSLLSENAYYSNLIGISTTHAGSDTVSTAYKVFRFADRQTNVPTTSLSVINIIGTNYLTDGFIAVSDS